MALFPTRRLLQTQWNTVNSHCQLCRFQFQCLPPHGTKLVASRRLYSSSNDDKKKPSNNDEDFLQMGKRKETFFQSLISSETSPSFWSSVPAVPKAPPTDLAIGMDDASAISAGLKAPPSVQCFSGMDIRNMDETSRIKIHKASSELATAQSYSLMNALNPRHRKEIFIMEESEYKHTFVGKKRPPLLDRLAEAENYFWRSFEPDTENRTDYMCTMHADIDLRPPSVKRWINKIKLMKEIEEQKYNPKRNEILGPELSLAHFIVFRKGKVKFLGKQDWVTSYRKDSKPGVPDEDLPGMTFELCTLPTKYDPRYRVEAVDATGMNLHWEGFSNFENTSFLKWLCLRDSPYIDDWCLDRISRMFGEQLEYIDVSGCPRVTDKGIGALHRCRRLKAIRAENMPHLENLEIVSAMLEDHNPNLAVIGVDYEGKMEQLKLEGEELERQALLSAESKKEELQDSMPLIEYPINSVKPV